MKIFLININDKLKGLILQEEEETLRLISPEKYEDFISKKDDSGAALIYITDCIEMISDARWQHYVEEEKEKPIESFNSSELIFKLAKNFEKLCQEAAEFSIDPKNVIISESESLIRKINNDIKNKYKREPQLRFNDESWLGLDREVENIAVKIFENVTQTLGIYWDKDSKKWTGKSNWQNNWRALRKRIETNAHANKFQEWKYGPWIVDFGDVLSKS